MWNGVSSWDFFAASVTEPRQARAGRPFLTFIVRTAAIRSRPPLYKQKPRRGAGAHVALGEWLSLLVGSLNTERRRSGRTPRA